MSDQLPQQKRGGSFQQPAETNSFGDQYFNFFLAANWEGENAIDDLGFILDPQQSQAQTPTGGPAQVDGLNFLERWL